jgi:hypothetical protein
MRERQKQDRYAVGERRSDAGECVFRSRAILHHEDAGWLAVGHSREPVGHINADPFLPADDRADAGGDRILDQGRRWEAKECRYTLAFEDFNDGIGGSHTTFPWFSWIATSVGGATAKGKTDGRLSPIRMRCGLRRRI